MVSYRLDHLDAKGISTERKNMELQCAGKETGDQLGTSVRNLWLMMVNIWLIYG